VGQWDDGWDDGFHARYGDSVLEQAHIAFGEVATTQDLRDLIAAGDLNPNAVELIVGWLDLHHPEDAAAVAVTAAYAEWLLESSTGPESGCPRCGGSGKALSISPCNRCWGTGRIRETQEGE